MDFPGGSDSKTSVYNVRDPGSIPELERSLGEGTGNPLQYSCLENPMDWGTWLQSMGSQRVGHDWETSLSLSLSRIKVRLFLCQHLSEMCSKGYRKLHLSVTLSASLLCFLSSLSDAPAFQPLFMSCWQHSSPPPGPHWPLVFSTLFAILFLSYSSSWWPSWESPFWSSGELW